MLCCYFDLDGTLVDSRAPILLSLNHALESVGIDPIQAEALDEFIGPPLHDQIPAFLERREQPQMLSQQIISAFRAEYEFQCVELAELYPGVDETVTALAGSSSLAIVTSKPLRFAVPILEAVRLYEYLDVVEGIDPTHAEPKTETLRRAMSRMGKLAPCSVSVMIGDRTHDVSAGRELGTRTVGVTWGHGTEEELVGSGADMLAHSPDELLHFLERLAD